LVEVYNDLREQPENHAMRAFFIACVIALILAIGGYYALSAIQEPVAEAFSTSAVRLSS
jgi:hypothetical protein